MYAVPCSLFKRSDRETFVVTNALYSPRSFFISARIRPCAAAAAFTSSAVIRDAMSNRSLIPGPNFGSALPCTKAALHAQASAPCRTRNVPSHCSGPPREDPIEMEPSPRLRTWVIESRLPGGEDLYRGEH